MGAPLGRAGMWWRKRRCGELRSVPIDSAAQGQFAGWFQSACPFRRDWITSRRLPAGILFAYAQGLPSRFGQTVRRETRSICQHGASPAAARWSVRGPDRTGCKRCPPGLREMPSMTPT